jgi:uncharacterized protein YhbP (UPF0306 family)
MSAESKCDTFLKKNHKIIMELVQHRHTNPADRLSQVNGVISAPSHKVPSFKAIQVYHSTRIA